MKIFKLIGIGIIVTVFAIGYVHQRVEIFKEGYDLQKSLRYLTCLIDQNRELVYNLSKLESSRNLLASFNSKEIEFTGYRTLNTPSYQYIYDEVDGKKGNESFISKLFSFFTVNAEAKSRG